MSMELTELLAEYNLQETEREERRAAENMNALRSRRRR